MRYLLSLLLLFIASQTLVAQIDMPRFSEPSTISQQVGSTILELTYERPKQNERVIFGELVPYDQVWRTGAGECTKIRFNNPVYIDQKRVEAGYYSLLSIPSEDSWTFILNKDTTLYGSYGYKPELDVVRKKVTLQYSQKHYEAMSLQFDVKHETALLSFNWDHVEAQLIINTRAYTRLVEQVEDILTNEYDLESNLYTNLAEYFIHNRSGFGPEYYTYAERLLDKAFSLGQVSSFTYRVKTDLLKLQGKRDEYMKVSKDHLKYLEDEKPYDGYEKSIKEIQENIKNYER